MCEAYEPWRCSYNTTGVREACEVMLHRGIEIDVSSHLLVLPLIDTLAQNGDRFGIKNYYKERRIVVNINRSRVNFFPFFQICFSSTMTSIYFSHHSVSLVTELLDVSSEIVSISGGKELWHAWFFDYQNGIEEFFLQKQNIVNINLLASIYMEWIIVFMSSTSIHQ